MFGFFQRLIPITDPPQVDGHSVTPPNTLLAFYWFYVRQTRWLYASLLVTGAISASVDTLIPVFIGRVVTLAGTSDRVSAFHAALPSLLLLGGAILIVMPSVLLLDSLIRHVAITPGTTILVRWQAHWHVVRQSWPFFQNDFAGRIASRVMGVAAPIRETILSSIRALWYLLIYASSAVAWLVSMDWRLAMPVLGWFALYMVLMRVLVPQMRDRSKATSLMRSLSSGRIVDSYTNILTVKLFARASDEDAHIREALDRNLTTMQAEMRLDSIFVVCLNLLNLSLLASTSSVAIWLWYIGALHGAAIAVALPLVWRITTMAGWVAWEIASIFENIGAVQEAMLSIAVPHGLEDRKDATELLADRGEIRFQDISFSYGTATTIDHLSLTIRPGEKVGLVGRSGAGKSTLVNLLLRFYDLQSGHILIDGQDIRQVKQESLRAAIGMVTQDTSLLHRSIAENIRYGRRDASMEAVMQAAREAHAHDFILALEDWEGRRGYDARVGERGVKLSGGQRQRIAIARVVLKNAPILVLDEATSALDSEVEAAIQEQLDRLMAHKTTIAIAHRLSTIARMDRLVVMDRGAIVEVGSHDQLLQANGIYADLWARQSGGFIGSDAPAQAAE